MSKRLIYIMLVLPAILLQAVQVFGQNPSNKEVLNRLRELSAQFINTPYIQFDITYKYANEEAPAEILDTLSGNCRLWGSKYWYRLANTEALSNSSDMVVVFREDKLIYLTKPPSGNAAIHSLALIDSLLEGKYPVQCSMTRLKDKTSFQIDFLEPLAYKRLEYTTDNKTGRVLSTRQHLRSGSFYDPAIGTKVNNDKWGIVEVLYDNFRTDNLDTTFFNIGRYISKEGNTYRPTPAFSQYSFFDANPKF